MQAIDVLASRRRLIWELTKRDLSDRFAGSVLGLFWAVVHPLVLMAVYVLVFGFAFKLRFPEGSDLPYDYPAYIIAGYLPWMAMMDALARSANSIRANLNLVKQVAFPVEVLPSKVVLGSLFSQMVGIVFLLLYILIRFETIHLTVLLLPVALLIQCTAALGLGWLLALVGTYLRDMSNVLQVFFTVNVYLTPIVFTADWTPGILRYIIPINPFSHLVYVYQDVLFYGYLAHPFSWLIASVLAAAVFTVGFKLFMSAKSAFGNVL